MCVRSDTIEHLLEYIHNLFIIGIFFYYRISVFLETFWNCFKIMGQVWGVGTCSISFLRCADQCRNKPYCARENMVGIFLIIRPHHHVYEYEYEYNEKNGKYNIMIDMMIVFMLYGRNHMCARMWNIHANVCVAVI